MSTYGAIRGSLAKVHFHMKKPREDRGENNASPLQEIVAFQGCAGSVA